MTFEDLIPTHMRSPGAAGFAESLCGVSSFNRWTKISSVRATVDCEECLAILAGPDDTAVTTPM